MKQTTKDVAIQIYILNEMAQQENEAILSKQFIVKSWSCPGSRPASFAFLKTLRIPCEE